MKYSVQKYQTLLLLAALSCALLSTLNAHAQEYAVPLPAIDAESNHGPTAQKATALSLPFFDDFTDEGSAPNSGLWQDHLVYLSNTFSDNQFSCGFAVFDANNAQTIPYDTLSPNHRVWADSLTSRTIDLSSHTPADSLWLSFYYEPQGNGYLPKPEDSLSLFFYNSAGQWVQVWATGGDSVPIFKQVMVPVKDTGFFNSQFSFRFVNRATHGISNSNWNLDYVYLNAQRNYLDTGISDIAYTRNSGNLLNDFTAMPYEQFRTNPNRFLADSLHAFLKNNGSTSATVSYGYSSKELLTGTTFGSANASQNFASYEQKNIAFDRYAFSSFSPPASSGGTVLLQTKYFAQPVYPNEPKANDTITQIQNFSNYFAYDDGSAEKAYFLHVAPDAPGTTATEFALYKKDTLRGVAIYFPRTVPPSNNKEFSLIVYKNIAINGSGNDQIIYQQDYYLPEFQDSVNKFHIYRFDDAVAMDTGVYYIGLMQSAGGFSDSLYIGLDVNREGGNHRYFNVVGIWEPSALPGALLLRPIVGAVLPSTGIQGLSNGATAMAVLYPNPASDKVYFKSNNANFQKVTYEIKDLSGRTLMSGAIRNSAVINISRLASGMYFFQAKSQSGQMIRQKFIRRQ